MPTNVWWIWIVLAALFFVGEIFTAAFFLLWFAVGAVAAGIVALVGGGFGLQLAVFIVASLILVVVSRRFADRFTKKQPPGIGADRFMGERCVVVERIDNVANTGRVRLDREEWRAESDTDEELSPGTRVVVTRVSGTRLVVRKTAEGD
jgi:membrane protein implicated in regulation of membrane protease activity